MILADKIIRLRKKNGWSQEELAEKMNVSRQAVAKWEGAQTVPSLEKILQLGELFSVTIDYLIKDEIENEEVTNTSTESNIRHITLEEANKFLKWRETASIRIAAGVFLCIFSVIPLLILSAMTEYSSYKISDAAAVTIGLSILLILVAIAVTMFISCGFHNAPYEFLEKDIFDTEYGVTGMVKEKQKAYKNTYAKSNIIGICICILSPIPLISGSLTKNELLTIIMLIITIFLVDIGVMFFIVAGIRWASMQKLLQEGEFTVLEKQKNKATEKIAGIYWLIITAIYLGWSFLYNNWQISWIIWPIAGVLFAAITNIYNLFNNPKD